MWVSLLLIFVLLVDCLDLFHVLVFLEFFERTLGFDLPILHDDDFVGQVNEVDSMSNEYPRLMLEQTFEHLIEDFFAHISVKCRDGVVHDYGACVLVDGASKAQSGFLTSGEVDAPFSDFSVISCHENFEVVLELAGQDGFHVSTLVHFKAK